MDSDDRLEVTVVCALPTSQKRVILRVPAGTTLAEAVAQSGLGATLDKPGAMSPAAGVFGKRRHPEDVLADGDRIEIYRRLTDDPKTIRRRRAEQMGRC